jgi:hypothetical protein
MKGEKHHENRENYQIPRPKKESRQGKKSKKD